MSTNYINPYETIFNVVNESIYIKKVTPYFIVFDSYDDCGELWRRNLRRKVFRVEGIGKYIKINKKLHFWLRHN
jgi:hypothetical protein